MRQDWKKLEQDVREHRTEIIDRLGEFSLHDVLLFLSSDKKVLAEQEEKWIPVIRWVNKTVNAHFLSTQDLEVPKTNYRTVAELKHYISTMSDKELAIFYTAAVNMRSVLLSIAFVKGHINAAQAFELSELEELHQAYRWGNDALAEARRNGLRATLEDVEKYLKS